MSADTHTIELLPAYALDSLDEAETVRVTEHLATCPSCRAELAAYEEIAGSLALAAPDVAPPAELKQKVMRSLQSPQVAPVARSRARSRAGWPKWVTGLFGPAAPAWRLAGLALAVLLIGSNLWWQQQSRRDQPMITPGGMQVVAMAGADAAPDAVGTLVMSEDGEYGTLVVDGLPPLDADHQYQLWLIRDGQRTSGGVFSVNPHGYGALWIASLEPLSSFPAFGVTIEPTGGSPAPTGAKVLDGSL